MSKISRDQVEGWLDELSRLQGRMQKMADRINMVLPDEDAILDLPDAIAFEASCSLADGDLPEAWRALKRLRARL